MEKETEDGRWKKKDGVIGEEIGEREGVELKREKVLALKHGSPRCCASCI